MSLTSGSPQSRIFFRLMLIVLLATSAIPFGYFEIAQSVPQPVIESPAPVQPATAAQPNSAHAPQNSNDLGSAIYQSASNPVSGKLPDTAVPIPNPVGSAYKNPFE